MKNSKCCLLQILHGALRVNIQSSVCLLTGIASMITIKANILMFSFSVYSSLLLFTAGLSVSTDRKDEFIYLLSKEMGFFGA